MLDFKGQHVCAISLLTSPCHDHQTVPIMFGLVIGLSWAQNPLTSQSAGRKVRDDCEHHNYQGDWEDLAPTTLLLSADEVIE